MGKALINYFKELFKSEVGIYSPEADKLGFKWIIYLIIGILLSIIIPISLVYIEVGQFDWNVFNFIWGKEAEILYDNGLNRGGYFICGICACLSFVITGFLTTYRINGKKMLLDMKQISRILFIICFLMGIACFIASLILY